MHPNLNLNQAFDFYSVFDGFKHEDLEGELFENIENLLLKNYTKIKKQFDFDSPTSYALTLLAKNNRKRYSINRKIEHFKALNAIRKLLNLGILQIEKSKENKLVKHKNKKLKKELRSYTIQDKIIFKNHFTRFFFRFLKPNENLILKKDYKEVLKDIKENFEHYQSFCFEQLSREFLEKKFEINSVQSYWDKDLELDLYYKDEKMSFLGEVKFKNKKICKNILNLLKSKCKHLNFEPDYYIIISKNGFSKKLLKKCEQNLLLFDLNDFKILL